jgi:hypothetical protein
MISDKRLDGILKNLAPFTTTAVSDALKELVAEIRALQPKPVAVVPAVVEAPKPAPTKTVVIEKPCEEVKPKAKTDVIVKPKKSTKKAKR